MTLARLRALPRTETLALVLSIAVLVALAVATQRAKAPSPLASYSSYDAGAGGARALYELLEREGLRVDRFERQAVFLDHSIATLVWIEPLAFDPRQRLPSAAETRSLESWVRTGGTLLYIGHDDAAARQNFLRLPFAYVAKGRARNSPYVDSALRTFGIDAIDSTSVLRYRARARQHVLVADARGPLVVSYGYGRGRITAIADEELFSNDGIGRGERARLAFALAGGPGTIAFEETTHGHFIPTHWWEIAPRALVIAVLLGLSTLAIATVGSAVRLGPPIVPVRTDDASTSDFIGALAGLLQSGNAQRSALTSAAASTSKALARSFGTSDRATTAEICNCIDSAADRRDFLEMLAVANNGYPDDRNLVRGVALAQRLRKDYAAHVDRRR